MRDQIRRAVVLGDAHIGFTRQDDGSIQPMHDRLALDATVQLVELVQPEYVIINGDMLDLAPASLKFPRPDELRGMSQQAVNECAYWLQRIRQACGTATIYYCDANHERRLVAAMVKCGLDEVTGLRPANAVDGPPGLSIQSLLAFDHSRVIWKGPYGRSWWIFDNKVEFEHGTIARARGGLTASAYLLKAKGNIVVGHGHRSEVAWQTRRSPHGEERQFALVCGVLCHLDGRVPSKTGREDWQQGVGVLSYLPSGNVVPDGVPIFDNGVCLWGNHAIHGRLHNKEVQTTIREGIKV